MRLIQVPTIPSTEIEIPVELSGLRHLIYNLWWSWSPQAHRLFHEIDEVRWLRYRNPVQVLLNLEPQRWEQLLLDEGFLGRYQGVVDEFERYMGEEFDTSWFAREHGDFSGGPVAYFSTEYGWHDSLGIYSGGLGILSGDHCKSASDLGLPFLGIGLMYHRGYFKQTIDPDGLQQHFYPDFDLRRLPVRPVAGPDGKALLVRVPMPGRDVVLRIWKAQVGRVPVLLLDSDILENHPSDRPITAILYVQGREMRLCQEYLLGIGGFLALRALKLQPSVWHMNEGHSALLALERIRERVEDDQIDFLEALRRTAGNTLFTTHTPVPAGNETFTPELITKYLADWCRDCEVGPDRLLALGRVDDGHDDRFNFTALAIRTSYETNGVSELHGRVADDIWKHLGSAKSGQGPLVTSITNGVHTPTWIGPEMRELLRRHVGPEFLRGLLEPGFEEAVLAVPDHDFWTAHDEQKRRLIRFTRERIRDQFARHGRAPSELTAVEQLLDPDYLTIGFARRFATYKRATLMFRDLDRLRRIVGSPDRPVQILFAGKAHPADRPGQRLIRDICQAALSPGLQGRVLFIENYNMRIARYLVQGVDLWLNNPRYPQEASGTSGMKVAVNGGLNCSVLDGWWCEGYDPAHGWAFGEDHVNEDLEQQDRYDAQSLYRVLADEVVPCYYERDAATGLRSKWIARMKLALARLAPLFSTSRMVREYTEKHYLPASHRQGWGTSIDEVRLWSP